MSRSERSYITEDHAAEWFRHGNLVANQVPAVVERASSERRESGASVPIPDHK